jgi:4-amino-4-deoxy-L-arabinose transferase-like glycosyltransferase
VQQLASQLRYALYCLAALLGVFVYFFGLDSQHIPKNGDEMVYAGIARATAASEHWLPLQADVQGISNTKPPLLFWQGIVSTDHGRSWTLWNLRYPSVIYTLLTACLAFLLAWRYSGDVTRGLVAALTYLAFYSTYRYGRPFLTNPPETFWLFLAYFILIYRKDAALKSGGMLLLLGAVVGIGLLYKSFALLLPVGFALSWCCVHRRDYRWSEFLRDDAWKLLVVAVIALASFCLWFVLDPDPQSLWREFVMKENAGKFAPAGGSYLSNLLWGGSSIWTMVLGAPINAALLALPVAALMAAALRDRSRLSPNEKLLWIWVLTLIVFFSLPDQRSARYLLDAMPAIAVLCALGWDRLGRGWFVATLTLCALGLAFLAYESWLLQRAMPAGSLFSIGYWLLLLAAAGSSAVAILLPPLTRPATPVAALLAFLSMATFLVPIDHELENFSAQASRYVRGREVWVPSEFSSEEAYRFMFPAAAAIRGYVDTRDENMGDLARRYPLIVVRLPLHDAACSGCRVLAQRLDLRGRLSSADVAALLHGKVFDTVFIKELLIESGSSRQDQCRSWDVFGRSARTTPSFGATAASPVAGNGHRHVMSISWENDHPTDTK